MAEWRVVATITVAGTVEAGSEAEAVAKAAAGIVDEMVADVGSYDRTPEGWLSAKVERAIEDGRVEAWQEGPDDEDGEG